MPNPQGPTVLLALDLAGTFALALSGGLVGVRARLDLFGIIDLATIERTFGDLSNSLCETV